MKKFDEKVVYAKDHTPQLNPLLFDENRTLKEAIRNKILAIVDEFLDYIQVDINVLDIRLVGSNAAYNYGEYSDLDIHIVTNLSKISDPEIIARLYFDSVKKNFKDSYKIKVKGIEVELYIEDVNTSAVSNGIYSVKSDKWIKEPETVGDPSDEAIKEADVIERQIIKSIKSSNSAEELEEIINNLYMIRKDSLDAYGENGAGNLAFKSLRNKGVLDKVKQILRDVTAQELSLESKQLDESFKEWVGGHPADDDLFHANADRLGLKVDTEEIDVNGNSLEFDYVVLKSPTLFYHATIPANVEKIKELGLLPREQAGGKYVKGVFLTGVSDATSQWRGKDTAVLKVLLPKGTQVYQDRQSNAVFVRNKIGKENII